MDTLTLNDALHLGCLLRGIQCGALLRWYPDGADTERPALYTLRSLTNETGDLVIPDEVRDAHVWCSGIVERFIPVRDVLAAMDRVTHGYLAPDEGDQPMAIIDPAREAVT